LFQPNIKFYPDRREVERANQKRRRKRARRSKSKRIEYGDEFEMKSEEACVEIEVEKEIRVHTRFEEKQRKCEGPDEEDRRRATS